MFMSKAQSLSSRSLKISPRKEDGPQSRSNVMNTLERCTKKMLQWFKEMGDGFLWRGGGGGDDFHWDYQRMFHKGNGIWTFQEEAGLEHVEVEGNDWAVGVQGQRGHILRDFREHGRQLDLSRVSQGYKTQKLWLKRWVNAGQEYWC